MQLPPVAATTVGSFPRPGWLGVRDRTEMSFLVEDEALREAQDDATLIVLHDQEQAGLDLLTDGEQRRTTFIYHVLAGLEGFDLDNRQVKSIRRRPDNLRLVPRVIGPVRRRGPLVVGDLKFVKAHTSKPVKMAVPGPLTIVDSSFDEFYGDEAALAADVAQAINSEILDLQAAGCDVIQIDEPAMTRYHEKVAAYGARALDLCLEGVTVPTIVHLCYGYPGTGEPQHEYRYPALIEMLMETRIGGFSLEFARSGYDPSILRACRDRVVMFGCVDPGPTPPESVEQVVGRVRAALAHVDPSRLWIAPDCGLMIADRDLARRKAELLAKAAREVRRAL